GQSAMSCTDRPCVQVPVGSLSRSPGHSVTQAPAHTLTHLQVNAPACPPASREDPHMRSFRHADQRSRAALHVGEGVVDRGVGAGLVEDQLHESTLRSSEIQSLRAATGLVVGPQQILASLNTVSKTPPTTWKEIPRDGPAASTQIRTRSPTFAWRGEWTYWLA